MLIFFATERRPHAPFPRHLRCGATQDIPIERVSNFLRHASVHVTEKHYNPRNRAHQEQAEADVTRSWTSDPVVLLENEGTPEVHARRGGTN